MPGPVINWLNSRRFRQMLVSSNPFPGAKTCQTSHFVVFYIYETEQ
jgi:hypothetical protein